MMAEAPEEIFIYVAKDTGRVNLIENHAHRSLPHAIRYVPAVAALEQPKLKAAIDLLESVLCNPAGKVGITGTDADNQHVQIAMDMLKELVCTPVHDAFGKPRGKIGGGGAKKGELPELSAVVDYREEKTLAVKESPFLIMWRGGHAMTVLRRTEDQDIFYVVNGAYDIKLYGTNEFEMPGNNTTSTYDYITKAPQHIAHYDNKDMYHSALQTAQKLGLDGCIALGEPDMRPLAPKPKTDDEDDNEIAF